MNHQPPQQRPLPNHDRHRRDLLATIAAEQQHEQAANPPAPSPRFRGLPRFRGRLTPATPSPRVRNSPRFRGRLAPATPSPRVRNSPRFRGRPRFRARLTPATPSPRVRNSPRFRGRLAPAAAAGAVLIVVAAGIAVHDLSRPAAQPGTTQTSPPPPDGTVTGHLYGVGGPVPSPPRPWSGTVTVTMTGTGVHRDVSVGASGAYSIAVPPGRYTLTGHSPHYGSNTYLCQAERPVTVTSSHTTKADVLCQMS